MENQIKSLVEQKEEPAVVAAFAVDTVARTVLRVTEDAQRAHPGLPVLCSGGVVSNSRLRQVLAGTCQALFAQPRYSTDNAMGIAILAHRLLERKGSA